MSYTTQKNKNEIWLVYDGQCPLCNSVAHATRVRQAVGTLHLINAREPHPILKEIREANLDLDQGMVVKFNHVLYHGADAQHLLAMIGSNADFFNRLNVYLFRSKPIAKLLYPLLRCIRNVLLKIKGISKINNLKNKTKNG